MLFGSSGIRGIANKEITPELALKVGKACGTLYKRIVIGGDPRTSSPMIKSAVKAGVLSTGAEITDIGIASTPTLAHSARRYDMGIMVTASHNPARYNGIKLFNPDGSGFSIKQSEEIERNMEGKVAPWDKIKEVRSHRMAISEHVNSILKAVPMPEKDIKVVVDCCNGSTGMITPYLLEEMGCNVVALNAQPDGRFPAHEPEPVEENLNQLKNAVKASNADIGIAHDCDGDRIVIVDKKGELIPNDKMLAVLAKYTNERGKIAVPVNTSLSLNSYLPNAEIFRTRVGDIFISEKLKEIEGDFGGEPSGTYVFPSFSYCPDGIYAAAKIVTMWSEFDIEKEIESIPRYHMIRSSILSTKEKIADGMEKVEEELNTFEYDKISRVDGIRVDMEDAWVLVRPSGTEPKIRVTVEAKKEEDAKNLHDDVIKLIKKGIK
ncbi:MAG: phosphoglucosamine mutase [Thermoplasmata archaeon]|nr:phosphoglucosamine mutase [Thermoplasmata archaeon]